MHVRKFLVAAATGAVALSVLTFTAVPASAAVDPDDTPGTPVDADLIGVGSDTSQNAMFQAIQAYNAQTPRRPTSSTPTPPPAAAPSRCRAATSPGRTARAPARRSSTAAATTRTSTSRGPRRPNSDCGDHRQPLQPFPFALDTLVMTVVRQRRVPRARLADHRADPGHLQGQRHQLEPGRVAPAGTIKPRIPQAGSGTRSFFLAQLKALNGNVDVVARRQRRARSRSTTRRRSRTTPT